MKVAFIGGINDGHREIYGEPLLHIELPIYDPNGTVFKFGDVVVDSETYLLDCILAPKDNLIYYRHESLNETECLQRLLEFYKRPDPAE